MRQGRPAPPPRPLPGGARQTMPAGRRFPLGCLTAILTLVLLAGLALLELIAP